MEAWDVIVVGAGAAGLAAAWHARAEGASVLVVNKGGVGRTGATITSGGGISAAGKTVADLGLGGDPSDTEENFLIDTLRAGQYLGDQELVQAMVTGVGEELRRLIDVGVNLTVTRRPPGHSSGRGVRIAGPEMQRVMTREAVRAGVKFREDFHSVGPLLNDGQLVGIGGLDRRAGRAEAIPGRTVVLATGGTTSNWHLKTSPEELTGDGHALALAAGAELIEMEMMQFLPCCLIAPEMWRGLQFPGSSGRRPACGPGYSTATASVSWHVGTPSIWNSRRAMSFRRRWAPRSLPAGAARMVASICPGRICRSTSSRISRASPAPSPRIGTGRGST